MWFISLILVKKHLLSWLWVNLCLLLPLWMVCLIITEKSNLFFIDRICLQNLHGDFFWQKWQLNILKLFVWCTFMSCSSIFFHGKTAPSRPGLLHYLGFMTTHKHTTLGRTPLCKCSAQRKDLYLTTRNTHKRHTCMPMWGFKPAIPASKCLQTHTLDCAAIGTNMPYHIPYVTSYHYFNTEF